MIIDEHAYYNEIQLKNQKNKVFYDKLTFVFIELPKFNKTENELITHFEKWLYFLKNLEQFDEIPSILQEEIFEEGRDECIEIGDEKRAIKDAINLLRLGISEELVAKGIGLSIKKVLELKNK